MSHKKRNENSVSLLLKKLQQLITLVVRPPLSRQKGTLFTRLKN